MPEPFFIIIITAMLLGGGVTVIKTITSYLLSRQRKGDLTSSELASLISGAVEESVGPLREQIARLERGLAAPPTETPRLAAGPRLEEDTDDIQIRERPSS